MRSADYHVERTGGYDMGKWQMRGAVWGSLLILSAIGCSDDADSGDGDGDSNQTGTGGFVTNSGGMSAGDGDGDVLDPCFGALVYCTSGCVDLTSDDENCGACGERCDSDEICEDSICVDEPESSMGGDGGGGFGGGSGNGN